MKTRVLAWDEVVPVLQPHLEPLAAHHNAVAKTFSGVYPIVPLDQALADAAEMVRDGKSRAEVLYNDGGILVGYCVVHWHGDTGDVDWLYVRDDLRGQGWGKKLLENGLQYLRENNVELVDLEVVRGNPAKEFYQGLGFEVRIEVMTLRL